MFRQVKWGMDTNHKQLIKREEKCEILMDIISQNICNIFKINVYSWTYMYMVCDMKKCIVINDGAVINVSFFVNFYSVKATFLSLSFTSHDNECNELFTKY